MSITPNAKFGKYKIVVCGSRTWGMDENGNIIPEHYEFFKTKMDFYLGNLNKNMVEIVSGCAKGPDTLAIKYAIDNGYKVWRFPAEWHKFGKSAGIVRNTLMADFSTHCIAFWDMKSYGTKDMIKQAKEYGLLVKIIDVSGFKILDKVEECPGSELVRDNA